jgi:V/A-type H+-transporting ATPase subunit D
MQQVSATRSELLARRAQIALAVQGRELLKEKRSALMREFNRLGISVMEAMQALEKGATDAARVLSDAVAAHGPERVHSAAFAAEGEVELELISRSVAGVPIVEIEKTAVARPRTGRGYSLAATSARIDASAESFEALLDALLEVAALELSLRRLADEINRTTRRVNALEHVVVPRLEAERAAIALVLEERELEGRIRLLRARSKAETNENGRRAA